MSLKRFFTRNLCHELIKIGATFVIITLVGGFIAHLWQMEEHKFQNLFEQKKYEKEAATAILKETSKYMDKLVLDLQLYILGIVDKNNCKQSYIEWKETFTSHKALINQYFGEPASDSFVLMGTKLDELFLKLYFNTETKDPVELKTAINDVEINAYKFNTQLIEELLADNIGSNIIKPK